ncbi:MAG TPA: ankyrin repeat domain-containing protein [Sedimenticola sp.]|nr:ankyrin repeat domain-containing protein [Sedimenticola sp.]
MKPTPLLLLLALLTLVACSEPDRPTIGLYPAIHRGDIDQIERQIYWGADINQEDADGRRPLHVAAEQGRYVIVRILLDNGAAIDAEDSRGHTPLESALFAGRTRVAELLIQRGAKFDPDRLLDEVVRAGLKDRDTIALLVRQGADPDHLSSDGFTPLTRAVSQNNRVLAKHLIAQGADVNRPDANGETPLAIALRQGYDAIERLLKRNGARPGKQG